MSLPQFPIPPIIAPPSAPAPSRPRLKVSSTPTPTPNLHTPNSASFLHLHLSVYLHSATPKARSTSNRSLARNTRPRKWCLTRSHLPFTLRARPSSTRCLHHQPSSRTLLQRRRPVVVVKLRRRILRVVLLCQCNRCLRCTRPPLATLRVFPSLFPSSRAQ